jgi:DNA-directed RNA polymerase subunit RPC12/RpoP
MGWEAVVIEKRFKKLADHAWHTLRQFKRNVYELISLLEGQSVVNHMGSNFTVVMKCANCSAVVDHAPSVPVEQRTQCPNCGSTARVCEVEIVATSIARTSLAGKARHGPTGRPFYKFKSGADLHRDTGQWMERDMVIDRQNDRYIERVVDPETGEVLHTCEEPLRKHQGHGRAKRTKAEKSMS